MNSYQIALMIGAAATVLFAWHLPRAVLWIVLGALSFIITTMWGRAEMPTPAIFAVVADMLVWLIIYHHANKIWELAFGFFFQAMVGVNIVYQLGEWTTIWQMTNGARVTLLEICNWAALAVIWLTILTGMAGNVGLHRLGAFGRGVDIVRRSLHRQRQDPPFTRV